MPKKGTMVTLEAVVEVKAKTDDAFRIEKMFNLQYMRFNSIGTWRLFELNTNKVSM
jgi:hypothetical protein